MDAAFVQERRASLEQFIHALIELPDIVEHPSVGKFLQIGQ